MSRIVGTALAVMTGLLLICSAGCSQPPFQAKSTIRPAPVYCFDAVGHTRGAKPFIFGGTCCCTPTRKLMDQYHADGILMEMTLEDLQKAYADRGIKTAADHTNCNNLCEWGPHVVKGGKCMAPPTPGTANYEEVRFGFRYVRKGKK
ncbi:MAG TPA: hypothetical protein VM223_14210 [Planctomycetota bacterium]|nr:hypothetical protein [Planctomycetota bacterium]